MSDAVMANTSVKIMHALQYDQDRERVGRTGGMSDFQIRKLPEFGRGECAVAVRGLHGLQHCVVEKNLITSRRGGQDKSATLRDERRWQRWTFVQRRPKRSEGRHG